MLGVIVLCVSTIDGSPAIATDESAPVETVPSASSEVEPLEDTPLDVLQGEAAVAELEESGTLVYFVTAKLFVMSGV